jgi:hypothetical protein
MKHLTSCEEEELAAWLCSVDRIDDGPMEAELFSLGMRGRKLGTVDVSGDLLEAAKALFALMRASVVEEVGDGRWGYYVSFEVRLGAETTDLFAAHAGQIYHLGPPPKRPAIRFS